MTQNDYENLATKMKELRIQKKLTQAEVASALRVTPGYISNVENNRTAMSLRILVYYAKLLNLSLDALIGTIDSEYQSTALDREIMDELSEMNPDDKKKLLQTIRLWKNPS
ncbi:MAG: helix-turn-helix domain-containing protein [Clostridiales bacterium]|nr:helix-turn-helix domain-containing protein [Clostridiales bacterium]